MATVNVVAKWTKSISADVVSQEVSVFHNGELVDLFALDANVEEVSIDDVPENTTLKVELVASDGVFKSSPAVAELVVGDLTAPDAPTNLTLEIAPKPV